MVNPAGAALEPHQRARREGDERGFLAAGQDQRGQAPELWQVAPTSITFSASAQTSASSGATGSFGARPVLAVGVAATAAARSSAVSCARRLPLCSRRATRTPV